MIGVIRSGLNASLKQIDVVSNNIANARTTGFKRSYGDFGDMYAQKTSLLAPSKIGNGTALLETRTSRAQGPLQQTGMTLDLAIEGQGMFVLNRPGSTNADEATYTRDGSFTLDREGYIISTDGRRLKSATGEDFKVEDRITVDGEVLFLEDLDITEHGVVRAQMGETNYVELGEIGLAAFSDETRLTPVGRNLFRANEESGEAVIETAFQGPYGKVISGALEMSNSNMMTELTQLLKAQQAFSGSSKLMQAERDMTNSLIK